MNKKKTKNSLPKGSKRISIILERMDVKRLKSLQTYWKKFFGKKKFSTTETIKGALIATCASKNITPHKPKYMRGVEE